MPTKQSRLSKSENVVWTGIMLASIILGMAGLGSMSTSRAEDADSKRDVVIQKITYTPPAASADSEKGKQFFQQLSCANCHSVGGQGGCLGPPLDAVGAVRDEHFLVSRLSDSPERRKAFEKLYGMAELMPHPKMPEANAGLVVKYLLTLPAPENGFEVTPHTMPTHLPGPPKAAFRPAVQTAKTRQGARIFSENGCASCHSVGNVGGWFGPPLDGIGARQSAEFIAAQVKNPETNIARTQSTQADRIAMMPKFNIPQSDVDKITAFLLTLPERKKPKAH